MRWHKINITLLTIFAAIPSHAQEVFLDLTADSLGGTTLQTVATLGLLSLIPALLMVLTCFPFMLTVLAILRQGIGLQQSPPNMLIVALALFLTWYVMSPVLDAAWQAGIAPIVDGSMGYFEGISRAYLPLETFMQNRTDPNTLSLLVDLQPAAEGHPSVVIPAFLLSELSHAFQIGFLIYLPFLVIDMVVSAVLMSMGMMMVPPTAVSLPFKLAFFVAADGWGLIASGLVRQYVQ